VYRPFLSTRYLKSRFVNLLSVAGVGAGVAVMIVVTSVMDGFQAKVKDVLRGTLSHLIMGPAGDVEMPPFADLEREVLRDARVKGVSPEVSAYVAHPFPRGRSQQTLITAFQPMEVIGIDWEKDKGVSKLADYVVTADKEHPFANRRAEDRGQVTGMFGRSFLEQFHASVLDPTAPMGAMGTVVDTDHKHPEQWIGRQVEIALLTKGKDDQQFRRANYQVVVSAVYDAEDQVSDLGRFYMDRETLRRVAAIDAEYMEAHVALHDYDDAPAVKESLLARLPGFSVQTWEEVREHYLKAIRNEKVLLLIVLSFVVLLAGFTILATLTLTVVEKTRDIGLLKAVGATTGGVLTLFLGSGLLIGVLGGLLGWGLGLFVTAHVNGIKDALERIGIHVFPPDIYLFRDIPTLVEPAAVAAIVVGGVLVAFLAGLPPALRAARMDPIVALRHE
jgi:lipoprotein-releasing system permease protein